MLLSRAVHQCFYILLHTAFGHFTQTFDQIIIILGIFSYKNEFFQLYLRHHKFCGAAEMPLTSTIFKYFPDAGAAEETHQQQPEQQEQHHVSKQHFNLQMCTTNLFCPRADAFIRRILPALPTFRREGQSAKITNLTFRAESSRL